MLSFFLSFSFSYDSIYCINLGGLKCPDGNYTIIDNQEEFSSVFESDFNSSFFYVYNTNESKLHVSMSNTYDKGIAFSGNDTSYLIFENFEEKIGKLSLKNVSIYVENETESQEFEVNYLFLENTRFCNFIPVIKGKELEGDTYSLSGSTVYFEFLKVNCRYKYYNKISAFPSKSMTVDLNSGSAITTFKNASCSVAFGSSAIEFFAQNLMSIKFSQDSQNNLSVKIENATINSNFAGIFFVVKSGSIIRFMNAIPEITSWRVVLIESTIVSYTSDLPISIYTDSDSSTLASMVNSLNIRMLIVKNTDFLIDFKRQESPIVYATNCVFDGKTSIHALEETKVVVKSMHFNNAIPNDNMGANIKFRITLMTIEGRPYFKMLTMDVYSRIQFSYNSSFNTYLYTDSFMMPFEYNIKTEFRYTEKELPSEKDLVNLLYNGYNAFCAPSINCRNFDFVFTSSASGLDSYNGLIEARCVSKKNQKCVQVKLNGLPTRVNLTFCYSSDPELCEGHYWVNSRNLSSAAELIRSETKTLTIIAKESMKDTEFIDISKNYNNYTIKITTEEEEKESNIKINIKLPEVPIPFLELISGNLFITNTNKVYVKNLTLLESSKISTSANDNLYSDLVNISVFSYKKETVKNTKDIIIFLSKETTIQCIKNGWMFKHLDKSAVLYENDILEHSSFNVQRGLVYNITRTADATINMPMKFIGSGLVVNFDDTFNTTKNPVLQVKNQIIIINESKNIIPIMLENYSSARCNKKDGVIIRQHISNDAISGNCHFSEIQVSGKRNVFMLEGSLDKISLDNDAELTATMSKYNGDEFHIPNHAKVLFKEIPSMKAISIECLLGESCGKVTTEAAFDENITLFVNLTNKGDKIPNSWKDEIIYRKDNSSIEPTDIIISPSSMIVGNKIVNPIVSKGSDSIVFSYTTQTKESSNKNIIIAISMSVLAAAAAISATIIGLCCKSNKLSKAQSVLSQILDSEFENA